MYVTPEIITTIVAVFGAVATIFSGIYLLNHRLEMRLDRRFDKVDERFEMLEAKFDARFEKVDDRFEMLEAKIEAQLGVISADIVDLKVAVARLEGPQPTLLRNR